MSSDNIINYLKEGRNRGFGFGVLKEKLLEAGYALDDVGNAISVLKSREDARKRPKSKKVYANKKLIKKVVKKIVKAKKKKHIIGAKKVVGKNVSVKVARTVKKKVKRKVNKMVEKAIHGKEKTRKNMEDASDNKSVLSDAIKEIDTELNRLKREKGSLKQSFEKVSSDIDMERQREKEYEQKIGELIEKEAGLKKRKSEIESKIDKVNDKMGKMSRIKSEMRDI